MEPLNDSALEALDAGLSMGGQAGQRTHVAVVSENGGTDPGSQNDPASGGVSVMPPNDPVGMGGIMMSGGGAMPGSAGESPIVGMGGSPLPPPRTGGTTGAGGRVGAGGSSISVGGASTGPMMCTSDQKMCGGACVLPSPKVGCGTTGCDACTMTAPMNGYLTCVMGQCAFDCLSGYTKMGSECQGPPPGSDKGSCPNSAIGCPDCGAVFGPGCCAGDKCGCSPIPWTAGFLGCI